MLNMLPPPFWFWLISLKTPELADVEVEFMHRRLKENKRNTKHRGFKEIARDADETAT